jgi:O-antigen/teichoic acid export membrane protein
MYGLKKLSVGFISLLNRGHERTVKAKKNILASFLLKGIGIAVSLLLVPMTIHYVNPTRYGIWITLSSIVAWLSFFDIGLTQGLRNRFAEAKARGKDSLAQVYVSTTYAILSILFLVTWGIFMLVNRFLDWSSILNVASDMRQEVTVLAIIVFTYFCIQFVLKIITTIVTADQQPAMASLIDVGGQLLSLLIIFFLIRLTEGSLVKLGIALCAAPLAILLCANVFFFSQKYRRYRPVISKVNFSYSRDLLNLGFKFFIIQIAAIVQFQTASIIIAHYFGPLQVTSYNIVFRYFGILLMGYTIFITPFWSASTEAYVKNDIAWIRGGIRKYNQLNILLMVAGIFMLLFSETAYRLWLGEGTVSIGFRLSAWGLVHFSIAIFGLKYISFLNGINALRIQFYSSLISPFIYLAVTMLLIRVFNTGPHALFMASVIANFNALILAPLQYHMVVNRNKKGIWVK